MSLSTIANFCSHMRNISKARLATTSFPDTKQILALCLSLQQQGFFSAVTRGNINGPDATFIPTTKTNISKRRLWLGLKYYDNKPVLRNISMVATPKKRVSMGYKGLEELAKGREYEHVPGLRPGECLFLRTSVGYMELREALQKRIGGELLVRAS